MWWAPCEMKVFPLHSFSLLHRQLMVQMFEKKQQHSLSMQVTSFCRKIRGWKILAHFQLILAVNKLTSKGFLTTAPCILLVEMTGLIVNCSSLSKLASKHRIINSTQFSTELLLSFISCYLDSEYSFMQLHPRTLSSKHFSLNTPINHPTHLHNCTVFCIFFSILPPNAENNWQQWLTNLNLVKFLSQQFPPLYKFSPFCITSSLLKHIIFTTQVHNPIFEIKLPFVSTPRDL